MAWYSTPLEFRCRRGLPPLGDDIWFNGISEEDTAPGHFVVLTDKELKLGMRFNNTGPYQGVNDDFRMHSRALRVPATLLRMQARNQTSSQGRWA